MRTLIQCVFGVLGVACVVLLSWLWVLDGGLFSNLWSRDARLMRLSEERREAVLRTWGAEIQLQAGKPVPPSEVNQDVEGIVRGLLPGPNEVLGPAAQSIAESASKLELTIADGGALTPVIDEAAAAMRQADARWSSLSKEEREQARQQAYRVFAALGDALARAPEAARKATAAASRARDASEKLVEREP